MSGCESQGQEAGPYFVVEACRQWNFRKPRGSDQTCVETAQPVGSLCADFQGSGTGAGFGDGLAWRVWDQG